MIEFKKFRHNQQHFSKALHMQLINKHRMVTPRDPSSVSSDAVDRRTSRIAYKQKWLLLLLFLMLSGCGDSSAPDVTPVASVESPRPSIVNAGSGSDDSPKAGDKRSAGDDAHAAMSTVPNESLQMLADLITPDTVAVLTANPEASGTHWEHVANTFGLSMDHYSSAERVSLLIGTPGNFTLPALTGDRTQCLSDTAIICQFTSKKQTEAFADRFLFVRGEYPIPSLFRHGDSGDAIVKHLRARMIRWHPYDERELWSVQPSHDVSVFRADERTIVLGASRLLIQMGIRREFLPLRNQILASSLKNEGGIFISLASSNGWLEALQQDEQRWIQREREGFDQDEQSPIFHAALLYAMREVSLEWDANASQPLSMQVTLWPTSWLDRKRTLALREHDNSEIYEAMKQYGSRMEEVIFQTLVDGESSVKLSLSTVTPPSNVMQEPVWILAGEAPPFKEIGERRGDAVARASLRHVLMALHNFHDVHRCFPAVAFSRDRNGVPLLSWRVALLPYLGEAELYGRFKLDEPWNSPHNIKLLKEMPSVFGDGRANEKGRSAVLAVTQARTAFDPSMSRPLPNARASLFGGVRFADVTDGTSNTLAVVLDPTHSVPWTKPEDLSVDMEAIHYSLGTLASDGCIVGLLDGSTRVIPANQSPQFWRALILRNDGREIPEFK